MSSSMQKERIKAWNCTRCHDGLSDFHLHELVHIKSWDVTAFVGYWQRFDAAFVVFRGTDSKNLGNWIANIDILTRPYKRLPFPGAAPLLLLYHLCCQYGHESRSHLLRRAILVDIQHFARFKVRVSFDPVHSK